MQTLAGCLLLIVEDEPLVALDIADVFKTAGAKVIIARTLQDAMHPGRDGAFDRRRD
jgi:DNA-binding response OmpR family regulator